MRLTELASQAAHDLLHPMLIEGKSVWPAEDTREMRGTEEATRRLKQPGQQQRFACREWEHGFTTKYEILLWIKPEIFA